MKSTILFLLIILLSGLNIVKSQTKILIYHQDFESGATGVLLNSGGVGTNIGINHWVINKKYNESPYPNTPSQDSTAGGTISFAPHSNYLHICSQDPMMQPDTISNCNYNPADSSDRFVLLLNNDYNTFCTLGITNVKMAFFYTGNGSPNAYAELYYSADYGPWIKTGTIYNNQPKWKYELIQNPAFNNVTNLRFGFRWVNKAGVNSPNTSIGIDDIFIEGDFDNSVTNFNLVIDSITPNPVCQNFVVTIDYHLTAPICGYGFCKIILSDATGSFTNSSQLEIYSISNETLTGNLKVTIPGNTLEGTCYKIRIEYYYTFYGLDFFTTASKCFEVKHCPNTITTNQPVITMSSDSVCVGSNIMVPFFSTGVFKSGNKYIAQLSDAEGKFPSNPNIIGTSPDSKAYDPATGSSPGTVSGLVNENIHKITNGCNYYIRIISSDPSTVGLEWGPFCIKHCDIETNKKVSLKACLHSCAVGPKGYNTTISIKIHDHDSTAIYSPSNKFKIEILDPKYFSVVDSTGRIGKITASDNSTLKVHIPCVDSLSYLGMAPGVYYMRIIATRSNHLQNMNGTVVFLTIGAPADKVTIQQYPSDSVFCVGNAVYFYTIPYNAGPPMNSTYEWDLGGSFFSASPSIGILFLSPGSANLTVQETNYGCRGPVTPNSTSIYILGPPDVSIIGPKQVCLGDTIHYNTIFQKGVFFEWTTSGGKIIDTSNNIINMRYDTAGVYVINILGLNKCGQGTGKVNILATAHQNAKFTATPPIVCSGINDIINAINTTPPSQNYIYSWAFDGGTATPGGNNPGPQKVSWKTPGNHKVKLTVTKYGCATSDSNIVNVLQSPLSVFSFKNQCHGDSTVFTNASLNNPDSWIWDFGDKSPGSSKINPSHLYADTGSFHARLKVISSNGCKDTLDKVVVIHQVPSSEFLPKSPIKICKGKSSTVTYIGNAPSNYDYEWTFSNGSPALTGPGPYEISGQNLGTYTVALSVSKNGCSSSQKDTVNVEACDVVIPNVFTPNSDNINNTLKITGLESFPDSRLMIFNRWGDKIYENSNYLNDWTGDSYPEGVYYYILILKNGFSKKGTVTILR